MQADNYFIISSEFPKMNVYLDQEHSEEAAVFKKSKSKSIGQKTEWPERNMGICMSNKKVKREKETWQKESKDNVNIYASIVIKKSKKKRTSEQICERNC